MAKRKRTKGQTTIYKTLHRKLNIDQFDTNPTKNRRWTQVLWNGKQFKLH